MKKYRLVLSLLFEEFTLEFQAGCNLRKEASAYKESSVKRMRKQIWNRVGNHYLLLVAQEFVLAAMQQVDGSFRISQKKSKLKNLSLK